MKMTIEAKEQENNKANWKAELQNNGWAILDCSQGKALDAVLENIAHMLGMPIAGRYGAMVERLQPLSDEQAHPRSLSRQHGLGAFPLHNDTAQLLTPCRYIVMGCDEPGETPSPTTLLDTHNLEITEAEISCINSASFFIKNGRKSFYSAIRSKDRPFFRFDPGCMQPVSVDGEKAINALQADRHLNNLEHILWIKNRIAIIDNWRMLHGRGNESLADPNRSLLRITVK